MKIIHVYDGHEMVFPGEGSVPSVVYHLAKYTAKKGHDVTVLERRWVGTDYEEEIDEIKFVRFDLNICSNVSNKEVVYDLIRRPSGLMRFILDRTVFAFRTNEYLKQNEFDVVHVHLPFAPSILININGKLRDKMVYTAHIGEEKKRFALDSSASLVFKLFSPDLYLMKRIKKSVVLNEPLKEKLINKGIEEGKLEVIPNGIEVDEFNLSKEEVERIKRKYEIDDDKVVVMFSGSITPRKGVVYLVKAIEMIDDDRIFLLIVGNPNVDREYAKMVMDYVKKKGINTKFIGFVPYEDLKALYSACDIFILPSFEEGDPIALKEALASGKPLIGSNVGGVPIQIREGWNGFLIEPRNEKQLAEKLRYLIENEEKRERMGKNSRKLAEEFDWRKIVEKYLNVYEGVMG